MNFQLKKHFFDSIQLLEIAISGATGDFYRRIGFSILIFIALLISRFFFLRYYAKNHPDKHGFQRWRYNSLYITLLLAFVLLLPIWISSLREILTVLGIFGAGVLIVFKEILLNIIAWIYLMFRRPFEMGNRISIDGIIGDVFEIRMLDFSMIEVQARENGGQSTGRVIHIPNSSILTKPLSNASKQFAFNWNEILIQLTADSNWQMAEKIVLKIANEVSEEITKADTRISFSEEEYAIRYANLTPVVYIEFKDGRIHLTLRHLTEPRKTRVLTNMIWREILIQFKSKKSITLTPPP